MTQLIEIINDKNKTIAINVRDIISIEDLNIENIKGIEGKILDILYRKKVTVCVKYYALDIMGKRVITTMYSKETKSSIVKRANK